MADAERPQPYRACHRPIPRELRACQRAGDGQRVGQCFPLQDSRNSKGLQGLQRTPVLWPSGAAPPATPPMPQSCPSSSHAPVGLPRILPLLGLRLSFMSLNGDQLCW